MTLERSTAPSQSPSPSAPASPSRSEDAHHCSGGRDAEAVHRRHGAEHRSTLGTRRNRALTLGVVAPDPERGGALLRARFRFRRFIRVGKGRAGGDAASDGEAEGP